MEDFSEEIDFTEEEIQEQLQSLGYHDVPAHRLRQFKRDLQELVRHERSRNSSSITPDTYSEPESYREHRGLQDYKQGERQYKGHGSVALPSGKENIDTSLQYEKYERDTTPRSYPRPTYQDYSVGRPSRTHTADEDNYERPRSRYINIPNTLNESIASTADSETGRKVIKRKVARKQKNGDSVVFEESIISTDDVDSIQERLSHLDVLGEEYETQSDISSTGHISRRLYSSVEPAYQERYGKSTSSSLILPLNDHPHTRNISKCDPVNRFHQFKQAWGDQKAPGERKHKGLRWGIREQMLYHDEVVKKSQRVYVPNTYVVPTDKKRKSLRWQVRADIAQGIMPSAGYELQ